MGNNINSKATKNMTVKDLKTRYYIDAYSPKTGEGSTEDPEFSDQLMKEVISWNYESPYHKKSGTNVYYPHLNKPKVWVGDYKTVDSFTSEKNLEPTSKVESDSPNSKNVENLSSTDVDKKITKDQKSSNILLSLADLLKLNPFNICLLYDSGDFQNKSNEESREDNYSLLKYEKNIDKSNVQCQLFQNPFASKKQFDTVSQTTNNDECTIFYRNNEQKSSGCPFNRHQSKLEFENKVKSAFQTLAGQEFSNANWNNAMHMANIRSHYSCDRFAAF